MNEFEQLQIASIARDKEWDPEGKLELAFFATELGGEAGEALNIMKKLERKRLGIPGSRAHNDELADELADTIISAVNCWNKAKIKQDLWETIKDKFNRSSDKHGFKTHV